MQDIEVPVLSICQSILFVDWLVFWFTDCLPQEVASLETVKICETENFPKNRMFVTTADLKRKLTISYATESKLFFFINLSYNK